MFLKQWYQNLTTCMFGVVGNITDATGALKTQSSWQYAVLSQTTLKAIPTYCYSDCGVAFGTGNAVPAYSDYKFSGNAIDLKTAGLTVTTNVTVTRDGDSAVSTAVYTIINNGTAAVTIGEIGIAIKVAGSANTQSGSGYALIEKTALDDPVTIPAGEVGKITYTIRADIPTA